MPVEVATAKDRFVVSDYVPAAVRFLRDHGRGALEERVAAAREELRHCTACPRACGVDRTAGELGTCNTGRYAIVASAFPHFGEEDCLRGWAGSGTIFFANCNLRCVFCQNWDISQKGDGVAAKPEQIAMLMLELQRSGCHNVNFVTPEHVVPQVVEAIAVAVQEGLSVPIVYNTSAYDSVASLRLLEGLIDIYMPDFKFWTTESSRRYMAAPDYPEQARRAIKEMHRQVGDLVFGEDGLAKRGLLLRHLVMPGLVDETRQILRWVAEEISKDTYVNVMGQYRPEYKVGKPLSTPSPDSRKPSRPNLKRSPEAKAEEDTREPSKGAGKVRYSEIARKPTRGELEEALLAAEDAGLHRIDGRVGIFLR